MLLFPEKSFACCTPWRIWSTSSSPSISTSDGFSLPHCFRIDTQFTTGYANTGLWVIRAVIQPPRDKKITSAPALNCAVIASHVRAGVWWLSFTQHLPRVSFVFILRLHLLASENLPGSLSSHLFDMRPSLIGSDHRGSFSFFRWNIMSLSELFVWAVPYCKQHLPFR